jgi:hypothetical protein
MDLREAAARAPALAISWGTIAQYVGKGKLERNESHTHKWMVFLRGAHNQDISYAISKVTFQLHRDYENYRRGAWPPHAAGCHSARALTTPHTPHLPSPATPRRGHGAALSRVRDGLGRL